MPGHGEIVDYAALEAYIAMLTTVRDRIAAGIAEGKTLAEVGASNPTAGFEERYGNVAASLGFVNRVYTSLTK